MKNTQQKVNVKLSDIIDIDDDKHSDAYLCSNKNLWDKNGLKQEAITGLPINYRVIKNVIKNFSASGIFTKSQIKNAINDIKQHNSSVKNIVVIDLIKEYHGFIDYGKNTIPFTWRANHNTVNFAIANGEVEKNEEIIVSKMFQKFYDKTIDIISLFSSDEGGVDRIQQIIKINKFKSILSEKQLLKNENINYLRLPCNDYSALNNKVIIDFAQFTQNQFNPETDWLHIHCNGGKGRSTSLSLIFDMFMRLENSTLSNTSFSDLIKFHCKNGGKNLSETPHYAWKQELAIERYNVLNKIYNLLLSIDKCGLKDIYSTAMKVFFLHQSNELHNTTFSSIIRDAGEVVQKKLYSDKNLDNKLYSLYLSPNILYDTSCEFHIDTDNIYDLDQSFNAFFE